MKEYSLSSLTMYRQQSLTKTVRDYKRWQQYVQKMREPSDMARSRSKKAISLLRRDHIKEANKALIEAERALKKMSGYIEAQPRLSELGFYKDALEEYVEARTYESFVHGKKYALPDFVAIAMEEVIGGICDMTGELVRRAVTIAAPESIKEIRRYRDYTQSVIDQFSQVSFTGKLRNKYDSLERNVRRLEQILYDIKMR